MSAITSSVALQESPRKCAFSAVLWCRAIARRVLGYVGFPIALMSLHLAARFEGDRARNPLRQ
jgi:hypothetical protein